MDWAALALSSSLAHSPSSSCCRSACWWVAGLAFHRFRGRAVVEALLALPLVLPPTVIGYYLLVALGGNSLLGQSWRSIFGHQLVFSFEGLLVASLVVNLPFVVQPMQRGFEAIPIELREASAIFAASPWHVFVGG